MSRGKEQKKMSSIALKLHGQQVGAKIGAFFAADIFLFIALSFIWLLNIETNKFGNGNLEEGLTKINIHYVRSFTTRGEGFQNLTYVVKSGKDVLINEKVFEPFIIICGLVIVAMVFQFMNIVFSYYGEYRRIKKTA